MMRALFQTKARSQHFWKFSEIGRSKEHQLKAKIIIRINLSYANIGTAGKQPLKCLDIIIMHTYDPNLSIIIIVNRVTGAGKCFIFYTIEFDLQNVDAKKHSIWVSFVFALWILKC